MASIKACWKQKKVLNKAYIRIWASGEQWAWWPCKKQPKREREWRQPACLCVCLSAHALGFTSREIPVMTSRGSMTLPRDLLIFLPWASLTTACRYTCEKSSWGPVHVWLTMLLSHHVVLYCGFFLAVMTGLTSLKGSLPVSLRPIITMRATQKNRMSWPVSNKVPG